MRESLHDARLPESLLEGGRVLDKDQNVCGLDVGQELFDVGPSVLHVEHQHRHLRIRDRLVLLGHCQITDAAQQQREQRCKEPPPPLLHD